MARNFDDEIDLSERMHSSLGDEEKARLATMDRVRSKYVKTGRDAQLERGLDFLIERSTSSVRMNEGKALVVVGESGAGKTTLLDRVIRKTPAFAGYGVRGSGCPLMSVDVPAPCTLKQLGRETLRVLGYPLVADRNEHLVWELVREKLDLLDVRILHFDEAHNVVREANGDEAKRIRKTLKSLLNARHRPVSLIMSGTPELGAFLGKLTENRRRSRFLRLNNLSDDDVGDIEAMMAAVAGIADLTVEPSSDAALGPRLIHASLRQLGTAIELTHEAIDVALRERAAALTIKHFADAFVGRTGNWASANPFLARSWADIDCSKVLVDGIGPIEDVDDTSTSKRSPGQPNRRSRKP